MRQNRFQIPRVSQCVDLEIMSVAGDRLKNLIEGKLAHRTTADWEARLIPAGVPCSAINNIRELKERHPEVFVTVSLRDGPRDSLHLRMLAAARFVVAGEASDRRRSAAIRRTICVQRPRAAAARRRQRRRDSQHTLWCRLQSPSARARRAY